MAAMVVWQLIAMLERSIESELSFEAGMTCSHAHSAPWRSMPWGNGRIGMECVEAIEQ
jgi:hypothetical protein